MLLELCTDFFYRQNKETSLEALATCTPSYHLQLDAMHTRGKRVLQIRTRPKSFMQQDQLHTYGFDLLGVSGTQEPICNRLPRVQALLEILRHPFKNTYTEVRVPAIYC